MNSVTSEANTTTGTLNEGNQKEKNEHVNKEKSIKERNHSKETIDASLASTLPHSKVIVHEHDNIKVDSSESCSFTFNPKATDVQRQKHQRTLKEQARQAN